MNKAVAGIIVLTLLFLGPAGSLFSGQNESLIHHPISIRPICPAAASSEAMLGAAYLAMKQFNWEIQMAQTDYFRAKYCRGGHGGFCLEMDVFFTGEKLEFWLSPQPMRKKWRKTAVGWIGNVQRAFSDYQCGDPEALVEAYDSLARRKRPSWFKGSWMDRDYREKRKYSRWFEWHDKYRPIFLEANKEMTSDAN